MEKIADALYNFFDGKTFFRRTCYRLWLLIAFIPAIVFELVKVNIVTLGSIAIDFKENFVRIMIAGTGRR